MSVRELIKGNPLLGVVVVVVLLGSAAAIMARRNGAPPAPAFAQTWFYDLGTGELFAADNQHPPIPAPSGAEGVRAMIYACGDCDPATWTPAYLETLTPQAKVAMQQPDETIEQNRARSAAMTTGRLIAAWPEKGQKPAWVSSNTPDAAAIVSRAANPCSDTSVQPQLCAP